MFRFTLIAVFVLCLGLAGCERDDPEFEMETPDGGVEVDVDE